MPHLSVVDNPSTPHVGQLFATSLARSANVSITDSPFNSRSPYHGTGTGMRHYLYSATD